MIDDKTRNLLNGAVIISGLVYLKWKNMLTSIIVALIGAVDFVIAICDILLLTKKMLKERNDG